MIVAGHASTWFFQKPCVSGQDIPTCVAVKLPDWELVMLLPEEKSAAVHVPLGQKYSWIFCGVGAIPFGSWAVRNIEKPPW
jgi:hypothetical protein